MKDDTQIAQLKRLLQRALRPRTSSGAGRDGRWRPWFERKLEGLSAFAVADRSGIPNQAWDILRMRFVWGWPVEEVARRTCYDQRTIYRYIDLALARVVRDMPSGIVASLQPTFYTWKAKACPHCGGDLYWDEEGTQRGLEGEWRCLQCSRRFELDLTPLKVVTMPSRRGSQSAARSTSLSSPTTLLQKWK